MRSFTRIKKYIVLGLSTFLMSICITSSAFADGFLMEVSPSKINVDLNPGQHYENVIHVTNSGTEAFDAKVSVTPYQVKSGSYEPLTGVMTAFTQIAGWTTTPTSEIHLEPGEVMDVPFVVDVPMDVPSGSQYAAIMIQSNPDSSAISYSGGFGVVLHSNIVGDTRVSGSIKSQNISGFLFQPPINAKSVVENTGNVESVVTNVIKVINPFTGAEVYSNSSSPQTDNVIPGTYRDITLDWPSSPYLGIYSVSLTTSFLDDISTISKTVFICPIWFITIILIIIAFSIAIIVVRARKRSRLKSHGFRFKN